MYWTRLEPEEIQARVRAALARNRSYRDDAVMGLPGTVLDREVFPPLPELADHALLQLMMANPNHIGCHTVGTSEPAFAGTHDLERDVLRICAEEILEAAPDSTDGYVASGGTESNIGALWTFRNHYRDRGVPADRIAVLASADTHYSIAKGADLLGLRHLPVPVDPTTREMTPEAVARVRDRALGGGASHFLCVLNMGTTLFGHVDDPDTILPVFDGWPVLTHVDAAFGGFTYPMVAPKNKLSFRDERLISFTMDAHKMLQAPYGTGIHLIRKGWIHHVLSPSATYVPGQDCTLSGSRSGANAVAIWMILRAYGSAGGRRFCRELERRARRLGAALEARGIPFYRHPHMNVVALDAAAIPAHLAERFLLVPDTHGPAPRWWKIVVMDHVDDRLIDAFLADLDGAIHEDQALL